MGHNLEYFYSLVKQRAPQLIMQQRNVQKGRQALKLSKMDYFPDIEIEGDGFMIRECIPKAIKCC